MSPGPSFPAPRCVLFFPGARSEMLAGALETDAPVVVMDLEDAVAADDKEAARVAAADALAEASYDPERLLVRINHPATADGALDLAAMAEVPSLLGGRVGVMVPKVDGPDDLAMAREELEARGVEPAFLPVIESARGLARAEEIGGTPGVRGLLFGGFDYSLDMGAEPVWEALLYARSRLVHAARLANVPAVDMPFLGLDDEDGLRSECARVRALGYRGKAAIHPRQVGPILGAFAPGDAEVADARRLLEAHEADARGAFRHEGAMVDRPALEAARRIVADAEAEGR